jgi:hypothetical protein
MDIYLFRLIFNSSFPMPDGKATFAPDIIA